MNKELPKYNYVDALRGVAILMVVFCHVNNLIPTTGAFWGFMGQGARGVQLFYIVSALTLFLSFYFRNDNREKNEKSNFFLRRFFRIAPMFYFAIFFYLITYNYFDRSIIEHIDHLSVWNVLTNFFFIQGVSPYWINSLVPGGWSVAIEFVFYLFVPFIFFKYIKIDKEKRLKFLYSLFSIIFFTGLIIKFLLISNPLINTALQNDYNLWTAFMFYFFPSQAFVFIIGFIVFHKIVNKDTEKFFNIFEILFILFCGVLSFIFRKYFNMNLLPSFIFYSFFLGYFVLFIEKHKESTSMFLKIFVNKLTIFFGKVSFSIYLIHFAVIFILLKFNLLSFLKNLNLRVEIKFFLAYIVLILLSGLISYFTFTYIEKPGIVLGKKLIKKINS